jgi:uncharacterized protein with von Willebrand factor type A (vWA) domain
MDLIQRHTSLSANMLAFCRYLRPHGFTIGPAETMVLFKALELLDPFRDAEMLRISIRITLAKTRGQQLKFDELYPQYWRELEKAVDSKIAKDKKPEQSAKKQPATSIQALKSWLHGKPTEEEIQLAQFSAQESNARKDFSLFSPSELQEINQLIQQITRTLARQISRRWERSHTPKKLDLRRTMRKNLRRGGELMELEQLRPQKRKTQLVLLCDVSKSMDLYSQFLIQFIYAFQSANQRIESFVFATDLHRVTSALRTGDFQLALQKLTEAAPGWSGGTRIGGALDQFCQEYRRLLHRNATVLILSDGVDTGDIELLENSMSIIHRKVDRIIWLNPLAGRPGYAPEVRGMQAAMPFVDIFAPLHNVETLRALGKIIG